MRFVGKWCVRSRVTGIRFHYPLLFHPSSLLHCSFFSLFSIALFLSLLHCSFSLVSFFLQNLTSLLISFLVMTKERKQGFGIIETMRKNGLERRKRAEEIEREIEREKERVRGWEKNYDSIEMCNEMWNVIFFFHESFVIPSWYYGSETCLMLDFFIFLPLFLYFSLSLSPFLIIILSWHTHLDCSLKVKEWSRHDSTK